jgi:serine/threonine-protein kinase
MRAVPRDYIDSGALSGPTAYFRGWVLARAGKRAAAEIELRVALDVVEARLKAKPNARSLLVAKALVLVSLGQREQAASLLRTVGQLYGEAPETWMDNFLTAELLPVEEAIRALAKQAETSAFTTTARLRIDPYLDRLRGHPDFAALQARAEADPRLSPAAHARAEVAKAAAPRADAMPAPAPEKSVAVLAFDNRSDDKVAEYLGEGISVDLITALQRVPGLVVRGSTSAFFFKGKNATAREIGEKLAVTYLLRGSVQQSGGQVRITAQLTRAATDEIVWACDPITKDLKAVFAIQDEIVALIAKNLSLQLGSSSTPKREVDPEAYRLLLEGRHHWSLRSEDSFARAESLLQRALELDEGWAMIHEALADLWVIRALYRGLLGEPFEEYRRKGQAAARRALQLDPTRAQPHASLGLAHTLVQSGPDWAGAERELRRAIDLAPNNATAHNWLGDVLLEQGRLDLAIAEYRRAEQLDPLALYVLSDLGWKLVNAQRFDEALRVLDRADALFPGRVRIVMQRAEALAGVGRPEEARAVVRAAIPALRSGADIYRSAEAVYFMKRLGFGAEAEAIAQTLLEQHPRNKFLRGAIFVGAGRREEGFALLEELPAFANRFLFYDPQFDSVRGDPRWTQLMEKRACAPEFQSARDSLARLIKEAKK